MFKTEYATPTAQSVYITQVPQPSSFDQELVNAIRDGKLVQVRWDELTSDEKRSAHVALFHQGGWQP